MEVYKWGEGMKGGRWEWGCINGGRVQRVGVGREGRYEESGQLSWGKVVKACY